MGYSGVARSMAGTGCSDVDGVNYCGAALPTLTHVACAGSELGLLECQHRGASEVFCAPADAVVVACQGAGDAQGAPAVELV